MALLVVCVRHCSWFSELLFGLQSAGFSKGVYEISGFMNFLRGLCNRHVELSSA